MLKDKFIYFFYNKFRHLSILIMFFLNIRFNGYDSDHEGADFIEKNILGLDNEPIIPKKIWLYWHDENPPQLVRKCVENIRKLHLDFEVNFLNEKTIIEYIDFDISYLRNESIQHQSDYIRLYLLKKYGGVWMDASIMCFKSIDYFINIMINKKCSFFAFYCPDYILDFKNPIFENWFIISNKNNVIISDWLDELDYCFKIGSKEYVNKIINENPEYIQNLSNPFYFFSYISSQKAIMKNDNYILYNAYQTAFYYHIVGSWRYIFYGFKKMHYTNLIRNITLYKSPKKMPIFIKLTGGDRDFINDRIKYSFFKKNSILYNFLND